jgi:hypothetical protein
MPNAQELPEVPRIDTTVIPQLPPVYSSHETQITWKEAQEWNVSGEMYRLKVKALRDKVGNDYLSALGEEHWEPSHPPIYQETDFTTASSPIHTNPTTSRPAGIPAIHSGRTLG